MCSAEQSSAYWHYFLFFGCHNHSISTPRGEYGQIYNTFPSTLAPKNMSDFEETQVVSVGLDEGTSSHKINTTKLVVLTIIIFFTVVGNFGVVLAILLRR